MPGFFIYCLILALHMPAVDSSCVLILADKLSYYTK